MKRAGSETGWSRLHPRPLLLPSPPENTGAQVRLAGPDELTRYLSYAPNQDTTLRATPSGIFVTLSPT